MTFREAVTGVDTSDFALVPAGVTGTITSVAGSGASYTVTVTGVSGNGTLGLNLTDDDSIIDGVGNKLGGTGTGNGNFTGQVYSVDTVPPTVHITHVTDPSGSAISSISIVFSEPVNGLALANLTLTRDGGPNLLTGLQTPTTSDQITWTLDNLAGVTSYAGRYVLTLGGIGSISDTVGNPLVAGDSTSWVMNAINGAATTSLSLSRNGSLVNVLAGGSLVYSIDPQYQSQLAVNLGAGNDSLTLDFSHGSPLPVGGLAVTGSAGVNSLVITGTGGSDNLTLGANQAMFGTVPVSFSGIETIQLGASDLVLNSLTLSANAMATLPQGAARYCGSRASASITPRRWTWPTAG